MTSSTCTRRKMISLAAVTAGLLVSSLHGRLFGNQRDSLNSLFLADDVDRAVTSGVEYLVSQQSDNGAISDGSHDVAITSLAIMAMAAIGTEPTSNSRFGDSMQSAIDYVLQSQSADGYFGRTDQSRMYGHGIATLMLTEILGMGATPEMNERIHRGLVPAIDLILTSQSVTKPEKLAGGWRYTPDSRDSDLSVTVWQLMALRSAKNDGLNVPGEAIDKAMVFLRNSYSKPQRSRRSRRKPKRDDIGGFSYTPGTNYPTFTMTSAGLLALQVCGDYDSELVTGAAEWLMEHPPKRHERFFYYGVYYYAQGMHQAGGQYAQRADRLVSELLVNSQRSNGSWISRGGEERNVGVVYTTALAILSLSVRYHYLPIYQR